MEDGLQRNKFPPTSFLKLSLERNSISEKLIFVSEEEEKEEEEEEEEKEIQT